MTWQHWIVFSLILLQTVGSLYQTGKTSHQKTNSAIIGALTGLALYYGLMIMLLMWGQRG